MRTNMMDERYAEDEDDLVELAGDVDAKTMHGVVAVDFEGKEVSGEVLDNEEGDVIFYVDDLGGAEKTAKAMVDAFPGLKVEIVESA